MESHNIIIVVLTGCDPYARARQGYILIVKTVVCSDGVMGAVVKMRFAAEAV